MRTRTVSGLVLFALGWASLMASAHVVDLMPLPRYEVEARDLLKILHDHLRDRLSGPPAFALAEEQHAAAVRPSLLSGMPTEAFYRALDIPDRYLAQYPHVAVDKVTLVEWAPARETFRLEYRGNEVTTDTLCGSFIAVSPMLRWDDTRSRRLESGGPLKAAMALGGLVIALVGLPLALSSVLVRRLAGDIFVACIAGVAVLTMLLLLGASLQFIDRFSFLGPGFFFSALPMLLAGVLPWTLPFGVLAGMTMVYGRIANNREEVILQFNGVRPGVLVVPGLVMAVLFTGITFQAALVWMPAGAWEGDRLRYRVLETSLDRLPTGTFAYSEERLPFALSYKERTGDGTFRGLTLMALGRDGGPDDPDRVYRPEAMFGADRGRIVWSDALGQVRFELEEVVGVRWTDWPRERNPTSFVSDTMTVTQTVFATERSQALAASSNRSDYELVPLSGGLHPLSRRVRTWDMAGLREHITRLELRLDYQTDQVRRLRAAGELPDPLPASLDADRTRRDLAHAESERFKRWSVALTPLMFVGLAFALGLLIRQGNLLVAFMAAVAIAAVSWYTVLVTIEKQARELAVDPVVVLLLPLGTVLLATIGLLWMALRPGLRSARHRPPPEPGKPSPRRGAPPRQVWSTMSRRLTEIYDRVDEEAQSAKVARPSARPPLIPPRMRQGLRRVLRVVAGTTVERFVLRSALASLVAVSVAVVTLFVLVDSGFNSDWFASVVETRGQSWGEFATAYYTARVPQILYMLGPLVTLLALAFTLTRIVRSNEYLVLRAGGVPPWRVLRPLLLVALTVGGAMLAYGEWGAPYLAEMRRQQGSYMDRHGLERHKLVTDTSGRALWLQNYRAREFTADGAMLIGYGQSFPPRMVNAWPVRYDPLRGWQAGHWNELTLATERVEGETMPVFTAVAAGDGPRELAALSERGGKDAASEEPDGDRPGGDGEAVAEAVSAEPTPAGQPELVDRRSAALRTTLEPADVNRRVTQILEDLSISGLRDLTAERPDWNAPRVMLHRGFIYPLAPVLLAMIGLPLVLSLARAGAWHGVALSVVIGVGFYAALISLSGFGLYSTGLSPGVILWGGLAPFGFAGVMLMRRALH